jgi:hypothetical protein
VLSRSARLTARRSRAGAVRLVVARVLLVLRFGIKPGKILKERWRARDQEPHPPVRRDYVGRSPCDAIWRSR